VVASGVTETYTYDALGRRTTISSTSTFTPIDLYYSSAWQVIEEDVANNLSMRYIWSPVYVDALAGYDNRAGTRFYVEQDANWNVTAVLGVVSQLFNRSIQVGERYVYDPYGTPSFYSPSWSPVSGTTLLYLFQGGRYDATFGLYNFRNRDLSPSLGRWMQQDPIGFSAGDLNLYRDMGNDPTNLTDPRGLYDSVSSSLPGGIAAVLRGEMTLETLASTYGLTLCEARQLVLLASIAAVGAKFAEQYLSQASNMVATGDPCATAQQALRLAQKSVASLQKQIAAHEACIQNPPSCMKGPINPTTIGNSIKFWTKEIGIYKGNIAKNQEAVRILQAAVAAACWSIWKPWTWF
jgi:RHS repeat-associated protein